MTEGLLALEESAESIARALREVHTVIPPLWPLPDYVAVNPCVGLTDHPFLMAYQNLRNVRDCDLLMPLKYFQSLHSAGHLTNAVIAAALQRCAAEYPDWFGNFELAELMELVEEKSAVTADSHIRFRTIAETIDDHQGSNWLSHIVNDITRHCAAHYDEGQALWASPWKDSDLYTAWREASQLSQRMDFLGLSGFRLFVAGLPADPRTAVHEMLMQLEVPRSHWAQFLLCEAFSVPGWASYIRYQVRASELKGQNNDDLVGLLAIRLAYDVALTRKSGIPWPRPLWPADIEYDGGVAVPPSPAAGVLARYTLQVAAEQTYQRELLQKLSTRATAANTTERKLLQMVFCIDVRSEIVRRNLESLSDSIETFGFAGFFGMPLEFLPLGAAKETPQCPVLLQPNFRVCEALRESDEFTTGAFVQKRNLIRTSRKLWKLFQSSAISCFSFVESIGLAYLVKLMTDSLYRTRPVPSPEYDGVPSGRINQLGPDIHSKQNHGLSTERRIDLAEGMLRNLGMTGNFARNVAICGHGSEVTNNPYKAALDCGACGGHSGKPNAQVAAAILNDADVRAGLISRGIDLPKDTWFLAIVHKTTTDTFEVCDAHLCPASHAEDLDRIRGWLEQTGQLSRLERRVSLGIREPDEVVRRSRDWAEVRPEWGLAGNAAFIVAPRSKTFGLNLGGRTFLHSYDYRLDPELRVLELIMTAPMVVTNWINMQYYSSAVDPVAFGSGNKLIHNVVGQFGVLQGNGGDLMTGLPWQSIHNGKTLQHEPLRLLVVIDAPRTSVKTIIQKHPTVKDLVTNGWVTLAVWEGSRFYQWSSKETWESISL